MSWFLPALPALPALPTFLRPKPESLKKEHYNKELAKHQGVNDEITRAIKAFDSQIKVKEDEIKTWQQRDENHLEGLHKALTKAKYDLKTEKLAAERLAQAGETRPYVDKEIERLEKKVTLRQWQVDNAFFDDKLHRDGVIKINDLEKQILGLQQKKVEIEKEGERALSRKRAWTQKASDREYKNEEGEPRKESDSAWRSGQWRRGGSKKHSKTKRSKKHMNKKKTNKKKTNKKMKNRSTKKHGKSKRR